MRTLGMIHRGQGGRHCEDARRTRGGREADEAIQRLQLLDCFASLAMTREGIARAARQREPVCARIAQGAWPAMRACARLAHGDAYGGRNMPIDLAAVDWLYVAVLALIVFVAALIGTALAFRHVFLGALFT